MTLIGIVLVCGIGVYEVRYMLWDMPYDWQEIQSAGCLRVAAIQGDTTFVRHVSRFAEVRNLRMEVKYCSNKDELWFLLAAYKTDLVRFPNDRKEYSWGTRKSSVGLQDTIDYWYDRNVRKISPWDDTFRKYGDSIGWDWKLLAAVGYVESKFKNVNGTTGLGVMQLSRSTAAKFGAKGIAVQNPHHNIKAAANYISHLDNYFSMVKDDEERHKFVLVAYNSGGKSVKTAMARARQNNRNECEWGSVERYFHNRHSKRYLKKILAKYEEYSKKE